VTVRLELVWLKSIQVWPRSQATGSPSPSPTSMLADELPELVVSVSAAYAGTAAKESQESAQGPLR
jgi:hypothetical protein